MGSEMCIRDRETAEEAPAEEEEEEEEEEDIVDPKETIEEGALSPPDHTRPTSRPSPPSNIYLGTKMVYIRIYGWRMELVYNWIG